MFAAFCNARTKLPPSHPFVCRMVSAMERYAKSHRGHKGKDWTAHLSYKTYRKLVGQGIPVQ